MQVQRILHPSGDVLPILLDDDGLPLPAANEWILGRRTLAENTLDRELRELIPLFRWAQKRPIDLYERIESGRGFSEADVKGGLVEALRRDQRKGRVTKIAVTPDVFNSRIGTATNFLGWITDSVLSRIPADDSKYLQIREHHGRLLTWLSTSTVNPPRGGGRQRKQLTPEQRAFLISRIQVAKGEAKGFGRSDAVRFRNYVAIMLMLLCGLRRGELLSLRVTDINIGSISSVNVIRREPDRNDKRRPRPHIKREGRPLPLDHDVAFLVDVYNMLYREELMEHSVCDHNYLIVSDEGHPLSLNRLNDIFVELRTKHPADLPVDFSPHTLRYTFSKTIERTLRAAGMNEERRRSALALLRGDSSLDSADPYVAQEIEEQANASLGEYQKSMLLSARVLEDVPY